MIIFILCILALILAYKFYGPFVEKQACIAPNAQTPAIRLEDGVDYVKVSPVNAFLIQFLNIAGIGPIFGPILGAVYGPIAFVWIILGNIIGGAVHDYFSGVLSIKEDGKSLPEIAGTYLNKYFKGAMLIFTAMLLFFVGVVFIMSPAGLISNLDFFKDTIFSNNTFWVLAILSYYFLATLLPVDKIITKLYPLFGLLMVIMTLSILVALFISAPQLPEIKDVFSFLDHSNHLHHELLTRKEDAPPVWPLLFVTITCGAISGFHSTQSPIISRCLTSEKYSLPVFYGSMLAEGVVAATWALAGMSAFPGGYPELKALLDQGGPGLVVNHISTTYLGSIGGIMAILAVAIFPITSGDTAFRSLRLTIVDAFKIPQSMRNRLLVSVPILGIAYLMTKVDFSLIWRYFAFSNMLLSTSVLWLATKYLFDKKTFHWITSIPAIAGTSVTVSYILTAPEGGISLPESSSSMIGIISAVACFSVLMFFHKRNYCR